MLKISLYSIFPQLSCMIIGFHSLLNPAYSGDRGINTTGLRKNTIREKTKERYSNYTLIKSFDRSSIRYIKKLRKPKKCVKKNPRPGKNNYILTTPTILFSRQSNINLYFDSKQSPHKGTITILKQHGKQKYQSLKLSIPFGINDRLVFAEGNRNRLAHIILKDKTLESFGGMFGNVFKRGRKKRKNYIFSMSFDNPTERKEFIVHMCRVVQCNQQVYQSSINNDTEFQYLDQLLNKTQQLTYTSQHNSLSQTDKNAKKNHKKNHQKKNHQKKNHKKNHKSHTQTHKTSKVTQRSSHKKHPQVITHTVISYKQNPTMQISQSEAEHQQDLEQQLSEACQGLNQLGEADNCTDKECLEQEQLHYQAQQLAKNVQHLMEDTLTTNLQTEDYDLIMQ